MKIKVYGSPRKKLSPGEVGNTFFLGLKLFLVAGFGAVAEWATGSDWGALGPVVASLAVLFADLVQKWRSETRYIPVEDPDFAEPGDVVQVSGGFGICQVRCGGAARTKKLDDLSEHA